jgi:replicative DNA helicase
MTWESYNFSNDFQDAILACVIRFPQRFWRVGEIIKPEYFTGPSAVETVFRLKDYVEKYGKYPTFTTLGNYAFTRTERKNAETAEELVKYIKGLASLDMSDVDAIFDLALKFAKERALFDALRVIHLAQQEGKSDQINAVELVEKALALGFDSDELGIELDRDLEKVIDKICTATYGVHTGYNELDKVWKTGWPPGWLIVPLAPPKSFKTAFCINLATKMASSRANNTDVLYYACEITQELAFMRAVYNVGDLTEMEMFEDREHFKRNARKKIESRIWGKVWFKEFPSKTVTISQIKAHAKMVMKTYGLKPKAIFVDYAETVRPSNTGKNIPDWRQQADIFLEARAMGAELGCCVVMPDRCNAETVGKRVPSMKSFQGSFEKAGIVDVAIGICMTDGERIQNKIRFFIFLNRHGEQLLHYEGKVDPQRMQITVDRKIEYNPDEEEATLPSKSRQRRSGITDEMHRHARATQEQGT